LDFGDNEHALRQLDANKRYWSKRLTMLQRELQSEPQRLRDVYQVKAKRIEPVGLVYLWRVTGEREGCNQTRGRVFGFSKLAGSEFGLQMRLLPANSEKPNTRPRPRNLVVTGGRRIRMTLKTDHGTHEVNCHE